MAVSEVGSLGSVALADLLIGLCVLEVVEGLVKTRDLCE